MYAGRMLLLALTMVSSVVALPNHLKAVVVDTVPYGSQGVSASFGGYSAKAGLGGGPGGGVLYAAADSPQGSAGAGLGGGAGGGGLHAAADSPHGSAGAGLGGGAGGGGLHAAAEAPQANVGGGGGYATQGVGYKPHPGHQGPTPFDSIFNIPISVLQSVNAYLNNRGAVTKQVRQRHPSHRHEVVYKTVDLDRSASPAAAATATAEDKLDTVSSGVKVSNAGGHGHDVVVNKTVNYDAIFNIPISALTAVNQLLNG